MRAEVAMIIVAGHLRVAAANRDKFLALSANAVRLARATNGCHDFVVAADPLDPDRVNVYERWNDRADLLAFRGEGPDDELGRFIVSGHVEEFTAQPI
jgi:quinol monooxygenase YgiN